MNGMLARLALLPGLILLGACERHGPPAEAYRHLDDQLIVGLQLNGLGLFWPCSRKEQSKFGVSYAQTAVDDCYVMRGQERVRGIWFDEFEGTRFFPEATRVPRKPYDDLSFWRLDTKERSGKPTMDAKYNGRFVMIEAVGRRTAFEGTGYFDRPIFIVDRIIRQRVIRAGRGDPGGPPLLHQ